MRQIKRLQANVRYFELLSALTPITQAKFVPFALLTAMALGRNTLKALCATSNLHQHLNEENHLPVGFLASQH